MTREEAIKVLEPFKACMFDQHGCPISDAAIALDVAIEALKAQMDGDTISRQEAAGIVLFECGEFVGLAKTIIKRFEELPSAQPEPCEDAVSRKLMYELGATCMARRDENGELVALGRLDMLPSAQPEPKWIPCSERLPEQHIGFYLVTVQKRRITALNVVGCDNTVHDIDIARWDYDRRAPQRGYHWCKADKVIAWMPLPEPYRQKEEP